MKAVLRYLGGKTDTRGKSLNTSRRISVILNRAADPPASC